MKKYLKAIGCFAIFVLAVFSYFREQSYKLNSCHYRMSKHWQAILRVVLLSLAPVRVLME